MTRPSTTLVSIFFDIKKESDASVASRPLEFYLENGRHMLSQPYPLILFCDPGLKPQIQAIRDEVCPANQTVYIEKNITDYEFYQQCKPIILKNREGDPQYIDHRNTASYCIVTNFKVHAMKIAYDLNPFHTTHFAWIDFGGGHICKNMSQFLPEIMRSPKPGIAMLYITYRSAEEIQDRKRYMQGGPCGLAGNFWTIEASCVDRLFLAFYEAFYGLLLEGVGHGDEQTFQFVYHRFPEMFSLSYGDYGSVYSNYFYPRDDYHSIRWFYIQQALNKGDRAAAKRAAEACCLSNKLETLSIDQGEVRFLEGLGIS